jgi:signal peptidase II
MATKGKTRLVRGTGGGMLPWLGLALILLIADQFTKVLVVGYYQLGDSTVVTSFFNLVRVHNTGAAFSFLASAGGWQRWFFTALGIAAAGFILWMLRAHSAQRLFSFALACILAGAVGNVIDRVLYGYVVDFRADPGRAAAGAPGALKPAPGAACDRPAGVLGII